MKSAGNRGVPVATSECFILIVLFVTPLGAGYVPQLSANQYQGGVPIREGFHYTDSTTDITGSFCLPAHGRLGCLAHDLDLGSRHNIIRYQLLFPCVPEQSILWYFNL